MKENIFNFTRRQINHIRRGGFSTFRILFRQLLLVLLASPIVLAARLLRPIVLIRFQQLLSDRIGHFAANTELYLCERDAGMHGQKTFDVFCYRPKVCNHQLKKMWDRTLHVSWIAVGGYHLNRLLPGGEKHLVPMGSDRDRYGLLVRTPAHLSFTREEEQIGEKALQEIGISGGTPFVCFHARDSAYLKAIRSDRNWDYHNYRDSNIHNYISAAEEMVRRGYYAVRIGAVVKEALNTSNHDIIDYATKYRTDFLDMYLGAKCHFFLGTAAGINAIPMIFRRPRVIVNHIPLVDVYAWSKQELFIPKKLWLREEHRFLTFREILESGIGRFYQTEKYKKYGIEIIENTPEEITAVAIEMDERLKGTWQTTEEDEELQRRFWSLFKPSEFNQMFVAHIGAKFLFQNQELLA